MEKRSRNTLIIIIIIITFPVGIFPGRVIPATLGYTPLATLPGAWRYKLSAGTGWPGVSIL